MRQYLFFSLRCLCTLEKGWEEKKALSPIVKWEKEVRATIRNLFFVGGETEGNGKDNSGGKQAPYFIASFLFPEKELRDNNPLVCVASKRKELVECKKSMKRTYRR